MRRVVFPISRQKERNRVLYVQNVDVLITIGNHTGINGNVRNVVTGQESSQEL